MKIGITGHQRLKNEKLWDWVKLKIDDLLSQVQSPLIGLSSLAIGADQVFAKSILENDGSLHVIVPFDGYEMKFSEGVDREEYFHLLNKATSIDILAKEHSEEESYFKAGKKIVDDSSFLIAVWDGKPAAGLGGTGDVVKYARQMSKKVIHLNPISHTITRK